MAGMAGASTERAHSVCPRGGRLPCGGTADADASTDVRERLRASYFPLIVARVPELRPAFLWRRWFLSSRSAAFDAAMLGLALALVRDAARRPWS